MLVSIYYQLSLFNAHAVILIVHIFMNVNKLCLNKQTASTKPLETEGLFTGLPTFNGFTRTLQCAT